MAVSNQRQALYTSEAFYDPILGGFTVALVTEDEPGWAVLHHGVSTLQRARRLADEGNRLRGLNTREVLDIVMSGFTAGSNQ